MALENSVLVEVAATTLMAIAIVIMVTRMVRIAHLKMRLPMQVSFPFPMQLRSPLQAVILFQLLLALFLAPLVMLFI